MKFLITGGCGFLGSNLAAEVLSKGEELILFDNLSRYGSEQNLSWLNSIDKFKFYHADTRSYNDVEHVIRDTKPDIVFHLAGQVAMTTSLANPRLDFETNVLGGNNLLECVRKYSPQSIVAYSSTNKVYGDLENLEYVEEKKRYKVKGYDNGFDETLPINFQSPYGCSKGATDQYMLDYYRMFGVRTIVFRHSSIFGKRQFSTYDQGWIGWFISQAILQKKNPQSTPFTISGNGKQVRDVLFAPDIVSCYFNAIKHIEKTAGNVYNIGGGMSNSLSLLELFDMMEEKLNVKLNYQVLDWRQSDQKVFVADITKAGRDFYWHPRVNKDNGIKNMIEWNSQINQ